jgi:hypothetical protein
VLPDSESDRPDERDRVRVAICDRLGAIDIDQTTPLAALAILAELRDLLR